MLLGMVALGAAFGAGGMWLADRVAPAAVTTADRTRIERVVRDYLLAHPEVLPEAFERLQQRETGRAVRALEGEVTKPFAGAWEGAADPDVTIAAFFDYNCGYCRASLPVIDRLLRADPKVRIVYRELPILAPSSRAAARASLQAAAQGRFRAFHRALYAAGPVTDAAIAAAARTAGVDLSKPAPGADAEIARNYAAAQRLRVEGTPAWVIGDKVTTGALPLDVLQEAIAAARAR